MGGKSAGGDGVPSYLLQQAAASDASIADWEHGLSADQYGNNTNLQAGFNQNYGNQMQSTVDHETALQGLQTDWTVADRQRYDQTYAPAEKQFVQQAEDYNSPQRQEQAAGQAMGDVASQYEQSRQAATANLESFGIDPSQTRFGALDLGTRVSQAAASAGAGTQARQQVAAQGMSLLGQAIQTGRSANNSSATNASGVAQSSGAIDTGASTKASTDQTYGNMVGTGINWAGQMNNTLGAQGQALGSQANYQASRNAQAAQSAQSSGQGIASTIGTIATIAALA